MDPVFGGMFCMPGFGGLFGRVFLRQAILTFVLVKSVPNYMFVGYLLV